MPTGISSSSSSSSAALRTLPIASSARRADISANTCCFVLLRSSVKGIVIGSDLRGYPLIIARTFSCNRKRGRRQRMASSVCQRIPLRVELPSSKPACLPACEMSWQGVEYVSRSVGISGYGQCAQSTFVMSPTLRPTSSGYSWSWPLQAQTSISDQEARKTLNVSGCSAAMRSNADFWESYPLQRVRMTKGFIIIVFRTFEKSWVYCHALTCDNRKRPPAKPPDRPGWH